MIGQKILCSFSGGRTSALMAKLLKVSERYSKSQVLYIFANTGKEREETLRFVDQCDKHFNLNLVWIEAVVHPKKGDGVGFKIVDFDSACRDGSVFEALIKKAGIPSKGGRDCTRDLKERPIHKFAKSILGKEYLTATGIRADEKHRISSDPKTFHPLIEFGIDEAFVRGWWKNQPFDLELKDYEGNCDLCFLKSTRKRLTIISENPSVADWWRDMEDKYSTEIKPFFDVYRGLTLPMLIDQSKMNFRIQGDREEIRNGAPELWNPDYDTDFDCYCKAN